MFDFSPDHDLPKPLLYSALASAANNLTDGEPDPIANMANVAALIWQFVPRLNWAGFYRAMGGQLVLGPFVGKPACSRIDFGQGVCGTAAAFGSTQLVEDVEDWPGHIACDAASRSELVVPILREGHVMGVIDLDSSESGRFDLEDAAGMERLAALMARII